MMILRRKHIQNSDRWHLVNSVKKSPALASDFLFKIVSNVHICGPARRGHVIGAI